MSGNLKIEGMMWRLKSDRGYHFQRKGGFDCEEMLYFEESSPVMRRIILEKRHVDTRNESV